MSARVVTAVTPDGRVVAQKRSRNGLDAARLRHEAEILSVARHPGVVELVACEADGDDVVLHTEFVGGHSVETVGRLELERAAGLVAALADVVADLHDLGVVHGRLEPAHVLIGTGGRPILCGFGGGGRVGSVPPPGSPATSGFVDPAASSEAALFPHRDVYGLGCVLRTLIGDTGTDIEPIPERRFTVDRLRATWTGFHRRGLLTLADRATDDIPSRRPPARRFARELLDAIPAASLTADSGPSDVEPARRTGRTAVRVIAITIALAAVLFFTLTRGGGQSSAASPPVPQPSINGSNAPTSTTLLTHVEDGRVIVMGDQRFTAGAPGDRVAVGDWDCDGTATAAVLRPTTGAVFVFDDWATANADLSASATAHAPGAVDLHARPRDDGCTSLVALFPDGTEQEIR
ncbi:MAG TPA: hypothetical protein VFV00_10175 [Acidimicrobiales bacterium]|nr:hypothetical protein [Acidimicrobiales bacterium]